MAVNYSSGGLLITSQNVNSINVTGATLLSQVDGPDSGFVATFRHDLAGCGGADSGIYIELKDPFAWRYMSCRFQVSGTAACWSFMNTSAYGAAVGASGTGNMINYNESAGDRIIRTYLAQDEPQFSTHDKTTACDNDANNFMRFNGEVFRYFTIVRRRNVNGSLAGIHHGRSCSSTGSGSQTIIDQIRIW